MKNYPILDKYLKKNEAKFTEESIKEFNSLFKTKKVLKGTILIKSGKINTQFFILKSGLVASFIRQKDGGQFIRTIFTQYKEVASLTSIIKNEPANASYKCLVDCEILEASFPDFLSLTKRKKEFSNLYVKVLESIYLESEKRITELSSLDASQRYLKLKKDIPDIDNLLPQYQIAHYLNVTAVQLSRVRKKIYSK